MENKEGERILKFEKWNEEIKGIRPWKNFNLNRIQIRKIYSLFFYWTCDSLTRRLTWWVNKSVQMEMLGEPLLMLVSYGYSLAVQRLANAKALALWCD